MLSLKDKTILITGASRGIGRAIAVACAKAGATVVPHASSPSDAAAEAQQAIAAETRGSASDAVGDFIFEDLSQVGSGRRLFAVALQRVGQIDAVVNNAGVYISSPLAGEGWDDGWRKTMQVNVQSTADICQAAIEHFRASGGGSVVNIASRAGHRGDGGDHAAYAASKGAVLAMTKTWARALAGENIRFFAIAPGWVETRMAPEDIAKRAEAVADIPLGRVAMPDEIASLVAFLLTDACPSAVGATFDVNGASYVR
jgi:NAD(P)-dependent dehydrogenase (short-subunit alcohol dehydrogenase family)